jgi:hypothetical protein
MSTLGSVLLSDIPEFDTNVTLPSAFSRTENRSVTMRGNLSNVMCLLTSILRIGHAIRVVIVLIIIIIIVIIMLFDDPAEVT